MPEFKIKCEYFRKEKRKFFTNEKEKYYHRFLVKNPEIIPNKYCNKWKGKFDENNIKCWIWVPNKLLKELSLYNYFVEENRKQQYQFIMKLGEEKAAKFMTKNPHDTVPWHNNMVLKTQEYFKNTVQKIGFWDNKNYFYEKDKGPVNQPEEQKDNWTKVAWICLPFFLLFLFILLIKRMSRKKN